MWGARTVIPIGILPHFFPDKIIYLLAISCCWPSGRFHTALWCFRLFWINTVFCTLSTPNNWASFLQPALRFFFSGSKTRIFSCRDKLFFYNRLHSCLDILLTSGNETRNVTLKSQASVIASQSWRVSDFGTNSGDEIIRHFSSCMQERAWVQNCIKS